MKYAVLTFGCRVNQADSLGLEEDLLARGDRPSTLEQADLVVVNTCSVTASADQAARQAIRRVSRVNPAAKVVVTGCYATRRPEDVSALPNVVQVVANDDKPRLLSLVRGIRLEPDVAERTTAQRFGDGDGQCGASIEPGVAGRTAFTLRVQTGCAESCSYCIIPSTRGTPRSTPPESVIAEAKRVVAAGFKEIALTGVHLGSYGRDLAPRRSLAELLTALIEQTGGPGAPLFRVSSLEPMDCTPDVVRLFAESRRIAPHFHLPLQHASSRVLSAMQRPYRLGDYEHLVDGIRARLPHASIGSDIIVGFPGETEQDFAELTQYLERSPLTHLHVFPYSGRPGTEASRLPHAVDAAVIRERGRIVRAIGERLSLRFRYAQLGATHRALTLDDGTVAVTGNYLKVRIPAGRPRNEWIDVRISEAGSSLAGEVVETAGV